MNDLNKMKLEDLIVVAKQIKYIPPSYDESSWTQDDIYNGAIQETLGTRYQMRASLMVCDSFAPLKLFFKSTLRNYIKIMYARNAELQSRQESNQYQSHGL